jgi:hypothetical protein
LIDSLDINAVFVFNNDYTYESQNEIYTGSTKGTWSFDSSFSKIFIVPVPMDIVLQSEHEWHIVTFDNEVLNVDHTYKLTLPDESYYIRHDVI